MVALPGLSDRGAQGTLWLCIESITCGWRSWSLRGCNSCQWHGNRSSCHVTGRGIKGHWAWGCLGLNGSTAAASEPESLYMTFKTDSFFFFFKTKEQMKQETLSKEAQMLSHPPPLGLGELDAEGLWEAWLWACREVADNRDDVMYGHRKASAPEVFWPYSRPGW